MRRVEIKPWREYFFSGFLQDSRPLRGWHFYRLRFLFHSFGLTSALAVVLLMTSPFSRVSRIGICALAVYGAVVFFGTRAAARGLFLKRRLQRDFFSEGDEIEVTIEIINAGAFYIPPGLVIEDRFEPSLESAVHLVTEHAIAPGSRAFLKYRRACDAGMGAHRIGPLYARVSDLQNLCEFRVHDDSAIEVHVYPRVAEIAQARLRGTPDSSIYGVYEVATRGTSVNFAGVRPFASGDSLRQIAWKVSAKRANGLMVKEFEKIANCDVTVFLNLDPRLHVGYKSRSTWEVAKDAALSIVSQQIEIGNSVQICSNEVFVEPARGEDHFEYLCRVLMGIVPREERMASDFDPLIERYREAVAPGSAVFYVSAFDQNEFERNLPALKFLQSKGAQVYCVYIDASAFLHRLRGVNAGALIFARTKGTDLLVNAAGLLELHGIATYLIRNGTDLARLFLTSTRGFKSKRGGS